MTDESEPQDQSLGDYLRTKAGMLGGVLATSSLAGAIALIVIGALDWERDVALLISAGLIATFYFSITWLLDEAFQMKWEKHITWIASNTQQIEKDLGRLGEERPDVNAKLRTLIDRSIENERLLDDIHAQVVGS